MHKATVSLLPIRAGLSSNSAAAFTGEPSAATRPLPPRQDIFLVPRFSAAAAHGLGACSSPPSCAFPASMSMLNCSSLSLSSLSSFLVGTVFGFSISLVALFRVLILPRPYPLSLNLCRFVSFRFVSFRFGCLVWVRFGSIRLASARFEPSEYVEERRSPGDTGQKPLRKRVYAFLEARTPWGRRFETFIMLVIFVTVTQVHFYALGRRTFMLHVLFVSSKKNRVAPVSLLPHLVEQAAPFGTDEEEHTPTIPVAPCFSPPLPHVLSRTKPITLRKSHSQPPFPRPRGPPAAPLIGCFSSFLACSPGVRS